MIIPSDQQIYERWGTLPDSLKDALTAEGTEQFVREFAAAKDLDDDDIDGVEGIIGYVLLGFLGADEFAAELTEQLDIDPDDAAALQKAVNDKIFAPHKKELDAIYKPATAVTGTPAAAPRMLDITSPKAVPPPSPAGIPVPVSAPASNLASAPTSIPASAAAPIAPKAPSTLQNLSGKGWSGTRADMPPVAPAPARSSVPNVPVPPPAPVMLQKEAVPSQPPKNIDFHLPSKESAKMEFNIQTPPKAIPAVIEFGKAAVPPGAPKPPAPSATGQAPLPRSGETKPPLASFSLSQQGRTVTEITANAIPKPAPAPAPAPVPSIPKPPTPPAPAPAAASVPTPVPAPVPPAVPTPPAPPAPQPPQPKVIVKNFT